MLLLERGDFTSKIQYIGRQRLLQGGFIGLFRPTAP